MPPRIFIDPSSALLMMGISTSLAAGPLSDVPKSAGLLNDALQLDYPAFSEWDIGGQVRFRYLARQDAGSFPGNDFVSYGVDASNDYFLFREKLHIGWQPRQWLKFHVEGRGAQVSSDDRDPSPDQDTVDLHQAYVEMGNPMFLPLTAKIGRQEMTYGDQRFIGTGDWNNTGRSFDAVKLRYTFGEKSWVDLFTSRVVIPVDDRFNDLNDYDTFSGLYASSQELVQGVESQAFFLARNVGEQSPHAVSPGMGSPSERDVYTYGVRLKSLPNAFQGWDFAFEGAGQFGKVVTAGVSRDLSTYALNGSAGYTFKDVPSQPRIGIGYDYASGDSDPDDGTQGTFESLFGANHSFYGLADLVGLRNLNSPHLSLSARPVKNFTLTAEYLLFWLADTSDSFYPESGPGRSVNGFGKNSKFGSYVGSEIDLVAKCAIKPWSEFQLGYAHFFAGDYIKDSVKSVPANGGATDADWLYTQLTVNF